MNPMMLPFQQKMQQIMSHHMDRLMGGRQPQYAPEPRKAFHDEMEQYFADIRDGKVEIPDAMAEALCLACTQALATYMGEHDTMKAQLAATEPDTADHEKHRQFKKLVDELRDTGDTARQMAFIRDHFANLSADEERVLLRLAKDYSKKQHAEALHMTIEEMGRVKKSIENKIK